MTKLIAKLIYPLYDPVFRIFLIGLGVFVGGVVLAVMKPELFL